MRIRSSCNCTIPTPSLCIFYFIFLFCTLGSTMSDSSQYDKPPLIGGVRDTPGFQNSAKIQDLALFAVDQYNKKQNTLLEFVRVVRAKDQVVAGFLYYLTLEAIDAGEKKIYEAKVVEQAWKNLTELLEFKHDDAVLFTNSDFGVKKDGPGLQPVPTNDPQVQDAANHAIKIMQQRPNAQGPCELLEVTDAKAEVIDDFATYNLVLKVKQGEKEEKFEVEVQKNKQGGFQLTELVQDHS